MHETHTVRSTPLLLTEVWTRTLKEVLEHGRGVTAGHTRSAEILHLKITQEIITKKKRQEPKRASWSMCIITVTDAT